MTRFVLDASVSLAWFLDDPIPGVAIKVRRSLQNGSRALVPSLWHLEMANGLTMAERKGAITQEFAERSLNDVEGLMAEAIQTGAAAITIRRSIAVARAYKLTAYDASYLETARAEHLALATLDRALAQAARTAGVPLIS